MRRARIVAAAIGTLALASACRDIALTNERQQFEWGTGVTRQLTYNIGRDGAPAWSPDGDSIYYSAEAFPGVAGARGVLLALPAAGGTVRPVFSSMHTTQLGGPAFHVAPALSPDGARVAFIDITGIAAPSACSGDEGSCIGPEPLLERARLIVRDRDESSSRGAILHDFVLPGRAPEGSGLDRGFAYIENFQQDGRVDFSIAWAPDGERLVFSDGTRLYMWRPDGGGAPQPVPNTELGVHPTWSNDGELIAFARLVPFDSADKPCRCGPATRPRVVTRRVYTGVRSALAVIRPDGTLVSEPGIAVDPAFGPDGALYASSVGRLVRVDVATGAAVPVAGGEGGYAPAPSPDGTRLAFMKRTNGDYDIWVVEIGAR